MGNHRKIKAAVLEADSIWLEYGGRKILQNIYIKVEKGEIVALLGRNGTGKSSLMQMIFGSLRGQHQSVRIDGKYIRYPFKTKGLICYVPQERLTPSGFTVAQCFQLFGTDQDLALAYFPEMKKWLPEKSRDLSGGQQRLVEILMLLLGPSAFVLLDEPFSQLAPVVVERLKALIVACKENKGILLSDHQYEPVIEISDHTYLLVPVGRSMLLKEVRKELAIYGYIRET